jgi:GNAT superfamily N-acetyltransferase
VSSAQESMPAPLALDCGGVVFRSFERGHADELVAMWRASFEEALGITDPHPIEEQRGYLLDVIVPANHVVVAWHGDRIVGCIAASVDRVSLLYLHPGWQNLGIGSRLLQWAMDRSSGRLTLFTFACNQRACRFYEAKGFRAVRHGFEQQWQLPDVEYEWCADGTSVTSYSLT